MRILLFFFCFAVLLGDVCEICAKPARTSPKPAPLFTVPFTHVAQNEPLSTVLHEFARVQGFRALVSPSLTANVTGSFEGVEPSAFLSSMAAAYRVAWFQQGRTINFYDQSEVEQAFLTPSTVKARELLRLFADAGMLSPQLTVRLTREKNILFVRAPRSYINQLEQAMRSMEGARVKRITMRVFPLHNAWAEDKVLDVGYDTSLKIPGVATILQTMVAKSGSTSSTVTRASPVQAGLLGQGLARGSGRTPPEGASAIPSPLVEEPPNSPQPGQAAASGPMITADPRMNAVVVSDAEYRMEYYERVIKELDKPVRLVEIHAAIVDIDSNFKRELGINFQGSGHLQSGWRFGGAGGAEVAEGTFPTTGSATTSGLSFSALYTRGTDYFLARVQALEEDGVARVLGRPTVLTTDNVQATLQNTSTYYIPVSGYQATDLFKVETGTVLSVTPHIIPGKNLPDGTILPDAIKLIVTVQDNRNDNNTQTFTVSGTTPTPLKQTKINTQAIVSQGQSLLIGGYYYEAQSDTSEGIPGLKNIPLLGRLFGSKTKEHSRTERLILITPRIISPDTLPAMPKRIDDPRFSQSPTEPSYKERVPQKQPVGGCTRRRLDYASSPDVHPIKGPERPVPMGEPAEELPPKPQVRIP